MKTSKKSVLCVVALNLFFCAGLFGMKHNKVAPAPQGVMNSESGGLHRTEELNQQESDFIERESEQQSLPAIEYIKINGIGEVRLSYNLRELFRTEVFEAYNEVFGKEKYCKLSKWINGNWLPAEISQNLELSGSVYFSHVIYGEERKVLSFAYGYFEDVQGGGRVAHIDKLGTIESCRNKGFALCLVKSIFDRYSDVLRVSAQTNKDLKAVSSLCEKYQFVLVDYPKDLLLKATGVIDIVILRKDKDRLVKPSLWKKIKSCFCPCDTGD